MKRKERIKRFLAQRNKDLMLDIGFKSIEDAKVVARALGENEKFMERRSKENMRQSKQWQVLTRDFFLYTMGDCNSTDVQKHLNENVTNGVLNIIEIPTHINTIQKYIARNRTEWQNMLKGIAFMQQPLPLQLKEIWEKLDKITVLLEKRET